MTQQQIIAIGSSLALPLPPEVLAALGIHAGDAVNVSVVGRQMVVEPAAGADRQERFQAVIDDIFERRRNAYQKLAEGHS
jgi:antitoxin component of MazEF toxin-antitoxin module